MPVSHITDNFVMHKVYTLVHCCASLITHNAGHGTPKKTLKIFLTMDVWGNHISMNDYLEKSPFKSGS